MNWLFVKPLRPFVLLAGAASLLLNLALLMPALYMLQVFDRVFASRSVETLVMLTLLVLLALALAWCLDTVRARALAQAGRNLDRLLSPRALNASLRHAAGIGGIGDRAGVDTLRDIRQLRALLAGSGILALFDAPWLPLHLLVITLMHPLLGLAAALGTCALIALAVATERLTRTRTEQALRQARGSHRHAEALTRNAEVIVGMGMDAAAVAGWRGRHDALLETQSVLTGKTSALSAGARCLRQLLQVAMLGLGAWLVIEAQASDGIMIAATILIGRALQPVEHLIGGWKGLIEARGAWQRLGERAAPVDAGQVALPAPAGRIEVENIGFSATPGGPALIRDVAFALEPGTSLGIIGPSASGKTVLVRLLLGIWQPQTGCVRIDGADIAQWDRDALGAHVG